ncbi:MAG: hypothetical protein R6U98_27930, partial [Pirellulaceae bacterium]
MVSPWLPSRTAWAAEHGGARVQSIFRAVGFVRVESGSTQAVLPLVGLAADSDSRRTQSSAP